MILKSFGIICPVGRPVPLMIAAHAGFGPMTAKLFEQMLNLKEKIKSFPIPDYKPSSDDNIVDTKNTYSKFYRLKHQKNKTIINI